MWPGWEGWNEQNNWRSANRGTYQQNNVNNVLAGDTGCYGCRFCFCFVCDTLRTGKKKCVARAAHGGGSGRYRTGRMEKYANGVTTQPKITHGQIWRGNNNSCCGSCSLAWSWCGIYHNNHKNTVRIGVGDSSLYCTYNTAWLRVECRGSPVCSRRNLMIHPGK